MGVYLRSVSGLVVAAVLLCGCGGDRVPPASSSEEPETPLTDRALAAGMLRHIDQNVVTGISGRSEGREVSAMVDTTLDSVTSVAVTVVPPNSPQAVRRCGEDTGYIVVECRTKPSLVELARRGAGVDPRMPALSGRSYDARRGGLLVQVWGETSTTALGLVRSLLTDPLIGVRTSAQLIAAGRSLSGYEEQVVTGDLTIGR